MNRKRLQAALDRVRHPMNDNAYKLQAILRDWHFEAYGGDSHAVACFPPHGSFPCFRMWAELERYGNISSVCGAFYVVNYLKGRAL